MIINIYAVRDRATDQFGTPMFLVSNGQAIRSFSDEVNRADKDNQLFMHSDDFDLFRLGTYDSDSGTFDTVRPVQLAVGKDLRVKSN